MNSVYPTRSLELISPSGERVSFSAVFGPIYQEGDIFKCKVTFKGLIESPPDISGYDSLQALLLAVQLYKHIVKLHVDKGGRVVWPGSDDDYDFNQLGEN